jgi:hypothetical protein
MPTSCDRRATLHHRTPPHGEAIIAAAQSYLNRSEQNTTHGLGSERVVPPQ